MSKKVKVGILGLGKMGILHSALIKMIPQAELVAIHDVNPKLSKYVKNTGIDVQFFPVIDDMFEECDIDAVLICAPPFSHPGLGQKCVKRNVDIFVEKPLAESLVSAKRMFSLVREKDIVHATGFTIAHIPLFKKAKSLLDKKILGEIFRYNISVYISQVFNKKKGWLFNKEKSGGGVIIDIASHLLYLTVWYFGLPSLVFAKTVSFHSDVEDSGTVLMEYENGIKGMLDVNWSLPGYRQTTMSIHIEAENGTAEITNDYIKLHLLDEVEGFNAGWTTIYRIDIRSKSKFDLGSEGFYDEDSHFIECCIKRENPAATWLDGLYVQAIVDAIYRSSESEKAVQLDLDDILMNHTRKR